MILKTTILSAAVNVVLNIVLIPIWQENAAALTTVLAELISFVGCWHFGKKYVQKKHIYTVFFKVMAGCIPIVFWAEFFRGIFTSETAYTVGVIIISIISYFFTEILLNNEAVYSMGKGIIRRMRKQS